MLVIGAQGFAKQILDVFDQKGITEGIVFFDDVAENSPDKLYDFEIIHTTGEVLDYFKNVSDKYILGVGNPLIRKKLSEKFNALGGDLTTLVSPLARIARYNCHIGKGTCILTNSIIENNVHIGAGCLINLRCTITHDTRIGEFCEICPGANISGNSRIGNYTFIGTGAILLPNIKIGNNVIIGAGAVVTRDIDDNDKVAGNPAKSIKQK